MGLRNCEISVLEHATHWGLCRLESGNAGLPAFILVRFLERNLEFRNVEILSLLLSLIMSKELLL
jgi:hypothetical protein